MRNAFLRASGLALACMLASASSGCAIFGFAAAAVPAPPVKASYDGLAGQTTAVMVWVDRGIRIDNPSLPLDIAVGVQDRLKAAAKDKKDEVKNTTFPIDPRSILRYQAEHPEIEAQEIVRTARILNVTRVIYIEVNDFATRPNANIELYRGSALVSIKVVEVSPDGSVSKVAYSQTDVRVTPDKKGPAIGMPNSNDVATYQQTVEALTAEVAERFFTHDSHEND